MSERAEDDVRGEQRRAARQQLKQLQRGEGSTAMAAAAERRSLPSPELLLGQPWSSWVDAAKLHGHDGAEPEESFKDPGRNREAMRLCREDMPIFGQCPAHDDFYLVMCSHCGQVVKPQAFQAHYERRHSLACKPPSSATFPVVSRNRGLGPGLTTAPGPAALAPGLLGRSVGPSLSSSSNPPKVLKAAKEKVPGAQRRSFPPFRIQPDKILTPAVKVEKMHLNVEPSAKLVQGPPTPGPAPPSSSCSTTVSSSTPGPPTASSSSSSALKAGLNCPSIPKPPSLAPGLIPNGKGHASSASDKKPDGGGASSRRHLPKKATEREFNPDVHCGVLDVTARKPCTRSLTCKTHSLGQRRAVPGRRKRFDMLLAEHKNRAREREIHPAPPQQPPPLRDPLPPPHAAALHDAHQVAHGNGPTPDAAKPSASSKPKFHSPGLPRLNSSHGGGAPADAAATAESQSQSAADAFSRPSSDEGENEERDESAERLDCQYSGYHPRPVAHCTFGSRLLGRGCYSFDRRWDRARCALTAMMDRHVNAQMWKKIPLASENSAAFGPAHRTSTNSHGSSPSPGAPTPYSQSLEGKPSLSYGTTLNARSSPQGGAELPAYGSSQARLVSSSPQMPSALLSSPPASGRAPKSRSGGGAARSPVTFKPKEVGSSALPNSASGGGGGAMNSGAGFVSGKKRKNSSVAPHAEANAGAASSPFKKNCANAAGFHPPGASAALAAAHSGVHSVGLNCGPGVRSNSLSLKAEAPGGPGGSSGPPARGPPSGSPAESIKRMSVMNSSDSTLSLGPFVHHPPPDHGFGGHAADARLEGKKRKSSPALGAINSVGGGGAGRPKVAKSPAVNNIHGKHGRSLPGTTPMTNNSHLHQPKARP